MNTSLCPRCGSELLEDAWESLRETEDGGFIMDAYPAYVCKKKCGYMKQIDTIPTIIAQQGDDRLLLLYPDDQGRILDIHSSVIFPPMHLESLLGRGYWEDYQGNHDVEQLLDTVSDSRAYDLETPNLFQFETSTPEEAFLSWLLSWSSQLYRSVDRRLYEAAADL
ncbi:hypothetical protein [Neobacillus niacini]|uniref:hypothetical protein n=1 Tax=Neobacillus niacini TaxID=86668 RepID=UPI002858F9C3|nr:hypothetical protein [Neobacillus niacini]MDR7000992.1 hypothetical protein [Neobacillus niacini]